MNVPVETVPPTIRLNDGRAAIDDKRGSWGMWLTIATEAALFVIFFFAYYYLARGGPRWLSVEPPKLKLAFIMLAVLLTSSVVLYWGEEQVKAGNHLLARLALIGTIVLGVAFLVLQFFEYKDHLKTLTPRTNAYGSIFYTITSFHAAHVFVGLLILLYVLFLPRYEPVTAPPHKAYHNGALYWHFVDTVWIVIVAMLYVAPNLR